MSDAESVSVFLLGRHTALLAVPSGSADSATVFSSGVEADRTLAHSVDGMTAVFARFASRLTEPAEMSLLQNDGRLSNIAVCASLSDFCEQARLSPAARAALLAAIAGQVAAMFRLTADPVFIRAFEAFLKVQPSRVSTGQLTSLRGHPVSLLTVADAELLPDGCMVAAFAAEGEERRLALSSPVAMLRDAVQPVAVLPASAALGEAGQLSVIFPSGAVSRIALQHNAYGSAKDLAAATLRAAPDLAALFLHHAPEALRNALVQAVERDPSLRRGIEDRRSAVRFAVEFAEAASTGLYVTGWLDGTNASALSITVHDCSLADRRLDRCWITYRARAEIKSEIVPVTGFCAWMPRAKPQATSVQPPVSVRVDGALIGCCRGTARTGAKQDTPVSGRKAVLLTIHPAALEQGAVEKTYRPAIEALAPSSGPRATVLDTLHSERPSARLCSLVIPIYGDLKFIRSQVMALAADSWTRANCEIVYVLDDPRLISEAEARVRALARITGLDISLVTLAANSGFGPASNAGARAAQGRTLMLVNSDVIPAAPGSLEAFHLAALALPDFAVAGPKLLYADDSVQHAGMYFFPLLNGVYQNMHYYKGYGRNLEAVATAREVPAVTGAAMALRREDFLDVGGFCEDYIVGDYEDSDLCLRLRQRGGICAYVPGAEFYHFERQSMSAHAGQHENQSTMYNRQLHHERWCGDIARLMQRPEFRSGANAY